MKPSKLTDATIRAGASGDVFARGQELFRHGAISHAAIQNNVLSGRCEGTGSPFYQVRAELDEGGVRSASCTCPYNFGGYCKHVVALLLTYAREPAQFAVRQETAELLADLSREQLLTLLTKLLDEHPDLSDLVEATLAAPSVSGRQKGAAKKRRKVDVDVYRRRVRGIMHSLDGMRASEAYWHVGGLAGELGGVEKSAREFLDAGEPETALRILLTLLEESHDGFDYVDDSDGELGDFLNGVGETLAEVILSLDLDEAERKDVLRDINNLHGKLSDYGVEGLSIPIMAAKHGWDETPEQPRRVVVADKGEEYDERDEDGEEWDDEDDDEFERGVVGYDPFWSSEDPTQILTRVKLNVLERQGRTDEYLALCLSTGAHLRYALKLLELDRPSEAVAHARKRLDGAGEALTFAQALRDAGHLDEAIQIGERGLKLGGHKAALGAWLGPVEEAQGRTKQALDAWLAAFREAPSLIIWQTIKRLAGSRWNKMKPEVMAALQKSYHTQPLAEVLLDEQDWDAAIEVADKHAQNYRVVATVADALIAHRPEWVIRASIKQAEILIEPTKSNLYPHAADWLRRAKAAYVKAGRTPEWQKYLLQLKEQYRRRPALMAQLKNL